MKRLIPILCLLGLFSLPAFGQSTNLISLTIVVTNRAVTSNTLVINASTRTWTNASSSTTFLTNLVSTATTATNLYNNIAAFPYSGSIFPRWLSETSMVLRAPLGVALSASQSGAWAILTLSTQAGPNTFTALWPIENIIVASNRTNEASSLVSGLSQFSTNAFATNSTAGSNFLTKGASPVQDIAGPVRFGGRTAVSSGLYATNGFTSALTNINPVSSNAVNFGNALRSEGASVNSLQLGSNALARSDFSTAVGNNALASNSLSTAVGTLSKATNSSGTAIGASAGAYGDSSTALGASSSALLLGGTALGESSSSLGIAAIAIGSGTTASSNYSIALGGTVSGMYGTGLGFGTSVTHSNSTAVGRSATTTATNQIRLGTSTETVSVPGILAVDGTQTNVTQTGTNISQAQLVFTPLAVSSLANGYNSAVPVNRYFNRYTGPSAAYTNVGFSSANKMDGRKHLLQFDNPGLSFTILHDSGLDAGDSNRVYTGTGALVNSTNNPAFVEIIRDENVNRWRILWIR